MLWHKHSLRFSPPMPKPIHLRQVPQGWTVNFNKLWVTVSNKKASPQARWDLPQKCKPKCVYVWGGEMLFYASLAYGADFHMREFNRTGFSASQDALQISKLVLLKRGAAFIELWLMDVRGIACLGFTHSHYINKYVNIFVHMTSVSVF